MCLVRLVSLMVVIKLQSSCNRSHTLRLVQVASEASCVILLWEAFSTCRPALNQFSKMSDVARLN